MDTKKANVPLSTVSRNLDTFSKKTGNLYESVVIMSKRANQIGQEMKKDLEVKLQEFTAISDTLEEVHENQEQIEISKFYEKLPKPTLVAIKEFENDEIYYRNPSRSMEEEGENEY